MSTAVTKLTLDKGIELEERKVAALEKIADSVDALTLWFEEIEKEEWSDRLQFYLTEFHTIAATKSKDE